MMFQHLLITITTSLALLSGPYKVDIFLRSATVQSFTDSFTAQTGVQFSYENSLAAEALGQVTLREEASLETLLSKVFSGKDIHFQQVGNMVVLTRKETVQQPPVPKTQPVRIQINGKVLDESGQGVLGASVIEKANPANGVIVDPDGHYSISVAAGAILVYECIGFKAVEEAVSGRKQIDVVMKEDTQQLEEVVVVGYGVQKKVNLTGAVASVTSKEFQDRPVVNVGQALQGMIPNLNITQGSGAPNASSTYNIRGNTSPNGGSPLILVDGVETYLE